MYVTSQEINTASIAIVDDEYDNVLLLERLLQQAGYKNTFSTTDSREVVELCTARKPDLVLLDLHMPEPDGFELLGTFADWSGGDDFLPVIVLTADISPSARLKALALGARDFLTKPIERIDLLLRTRNLLEVRYLLRRLKDENQALRSEKQAIAGEVRKETNRVIRGLGTSFLHRCDPHGKNATQVSRLSASLAREMGWSDADVEMLETAALLRDLGLAALPEEVVTGSSDPRNWVEYKKHAGIGAEILSAVKAPVIDLAAQIAENHHERWDGQGYPKGLLAETIPPAAQIVAVAEYFVSALAPTNGKVRSVGEAKAEISRQSGFRFDPRIVQALVTLNEAN